MKTIFVLLAVIAIVFAAAHSDEELHNKKKWSEFKKTYNKHYETPEEESRRFEIFKQNLKIAAQHQVNNPRARFGVTKFSDLSHDEFSRFYLMPNLKNMVSSYVKPPEKNFSIPSTRKNALPCNPNPTTFDWSTCGATTPVYNQGQCGSCWAFSATETIESYAAISGKMPLTGLSMQQIVSCDTNGEDEGCNGGFPTGAYSYVESAGGIESYSDYPYSSGEGESGSCQFNSGDIVAQVTNYQTISGETGLYQQTSVASGGPVSVCVDASSWSSYSGGVLTSCGNQVDHCVQLTGYNGYGQSGSYWIVRNSWGEDWGENGFIWVAIGEDLCSIGDYATIVSAD